ncbi:MAG TPA: adenylate kinase [Cyanobacteria bacterium UBA11368]|nr:adenylate kinase [Cyanobacteria bacterium UBA11368]
MTRLIFLGPPGAGKGTQAKILADICQIPHISTGDILRNEVAKGTHLGQKAKSYQEKGELVPDSLILDMMRDRLSQSDTAKGWILDGFPRNCTQAGFLEALLLELHQECDRVLSLEVPDEVLIARLLGRSKKEGRADDTEEVIRRRLEVYREQTEPLIDFYRQRMKLTAVNGDRSMSEVTAQLKDAIDL